VFFWVIGLCGVSASVSASVECEPERIVIIDSLLDLEHGGDTDVPSIVINTTALGLKVELRC
jgi:hypothetical protein